MSPGGRYYARLLHLLPRDFRARRGADLMSAFQEMRVDLGPQPPFLRLSGFYFGLTLDLLRRVRPERARARRGEWSGPRSSPDPSRRFRGRGPKRLLDTLATDVRLACRSLAKRPLFLVVATLSLTLGIGVNTAIFSLVDTALLRSPSGIGDPSRLVELTQAADGRGFETFSYPDVLDIRREVTPLRQVSAMDLQPLSLIRDGEGVAVLSFLVSANYFQTVETGPPLLGRYFLPNEDVGADQHFVVVLSHRLWQEQFGEDPGIVGRTVELNRHSFTVVGVAPADFKGHLLAYEPDLFLPLMQFPVLNQGVNRLESRRSGWLLVWGRMEEGATIEETQAALSALSGRLAQDFPESHGRRRLLANRFSAVPAVFRAPVAGFLGALWALVFLVLLITCSNLAGVTMARAQEREREIAIRLSLGSGRLALTRQLMVEVLLVFVLGGTLGILAARWGLGLIPFADLPAPIPLHLDLTPDARVLSFGLGLTLLTGIAFGLFPALQATRVGVASVLKGGALGGGRGAGRLRRGLVSAQIGLSLVLVLSAGLFLRSLQRAGEIDVGFDPEDVYLARLDLSMEGYTEEEGRELQGRILETLTGDGWVESVALSADLPMDMGMRRTVFYSDEWRSMEEDGIVGAQFDVVSPDYFRTLGIRLYEGRHFRDSDGLDAEGVAIASETFVRRFWPDQDPLGKVFQLYDAEGPSVRVVGVVADVKPALVTDAATPFLYFPMAQLYRSAFYVSLRATPGTGTSSAVPALRRRLLEIDPKLTLHLVSGMASYTQAGILPQRAAAWITTPLAFLALILSGVGVYGVVAQAVVRRRKEIGIRMALGAEGRSVFSLVLTGACRMALPGLVLGGIGAVALAMVLRSFLLGLGPWDPAAFAGVMAAISGIVLVATFVPARQAIRVDAAETLRGE